MFFAAFATSLSQTNMPYLSAALDLYLDRPLEIVLVRPDRTTNVRPWLNRLARSYGPGRILVVATESDLPEISKRIPLAGGKTSLEGKVTAYVCREGVCELPTSDLEVFAKQIQRTEPYPKE